MQEAADRISELEAQVAARDELIASQHQTICELRARVAELEAQVAKLTALLNRNSTNSHLPPSSDGPGARSGGGGKPNRGGGGKGTKKRKRGGQPGHRGHRRNLVPPEQVDHVVDLFPPSCTNCWLELPRTPDPNPKRDQVAELPPIEPEITEYRRHAVGCVCGHTTRAARELVPASCFGPRLMSVVALFTGVYHLSRRQAVRVLSDVLGVEMSLGSVSAVEKRVSAAIEPAVAEAWAESDAAEVKHADATSWLEAGAKRTLWVIATAMVTVFKVVADGGSAQVKPLFGACRGILVSDRASVFSFWKMKFRQVCWAHLVRRFISFSERDGPASAVGHELLGYTELLFRYWREYRGGRLPRAQFLAWMAPVRVNLEACLERAVAAGIDNVSGSCADLLAHREALWTFLSHAGVPPTNNHAEQELRSFVLWRKRSFGANSARGHLFAEGIMTVAHTARKQGLHVLTFLTQTCEVRVNGGQAPSLLRARQAAA